MSSCVPDKYKCTGLALLLADAVRTQASLALFLAEALLPRELHCAERVQELQCWALLCLLILLLWLFLPYCAEGQIHQEPPWSLSWPPGRYRPSTLQSGEGSLAAIWMATDFTLSGWRLSLFRVAKFDRYWE